MADVYVRVEPRSGAKQFYRCGMLFTLAWALVMVDEATARRLEEEQMLEVSEDMPVDYEGAAPNAADPAGDSPHDEATDPPAAAPDTQAEEQRATPSPASVTGEGAAAAPAPTPAKVAPAKAKK